MRWWNNKNIKGTTNKIYVFRIYKCVINKCNILTYLQVLSCFNHSLWCTTPNTNSCRWNSLKESHNTNCMEEIYLKQLIVRKILLCIYLLYWNCCIVKLFQVSKWCIILLILHIILITTRCSTRKYIILSILYIILIIACCPTWKCIIIITMVLWWSLLYLYCLFTILNYGVK